MGLHLQRGTSPDGLGHPDPQLQLTFFQEHRDSLRQEVAFQNMPKRWKEKRHLLLHFVSSTDGDSLTVISSDTREPGENIKAGLSSQRNPLPDTETRSLSASGASFFFSCLRKKCSIPPWGKTWPLEFSCSSDGTACLAPRFSEFRFFPFPEECFANQSF